MFESKKNSNVYHIYGDRLVVHSGSDKKGITLPVDQKSFMYYLEFDHMYYEGEKLFVVVATRGSYDVRFEVDEDSLELIGPPIQTY